MDERTIGRDRHGEVKVVHEVKKKIASVGEARHKRTIGGFRGRRWTSECDNRRGTSCSSCSKRDEIAQVGRLTGCESSLSKRVFHQRIQCKLISLRKRY